MRIRRQFQTEVPRAPSFTSKEILPRRSACQTRHSTALPDAHEVLRSSGQPLNAQTRAFFEPRFGHDFSKVRVHTDERATESARAMGARAYTVGRDVVFGTGQYAPETMAGRRLLAHELVHVTQQGLEDAVDRNKLEISRPGDVAEREADVIANAVTHPGSSVWRRQPEMAAGEPFQARNSVEPLIQRQGDASSVVPQALYKKFIADAASYGLPVGFLKRVQMDYKIALGDINETVPASSTITLKKQDLGKALDLGTAPTSGHNQAIGAIYHEATHAFLDIMSDEKRVNLAVDRKKFQSFIATGTAHYQGAPTETGGVTTDPARVFHEAAASYVTNRVSSWWDAFTALSAALASGSPSKKQLNRIKQNYDRYMAEIVFGYSDEGGFLGVGKKQVSTKRPMTLGMKYFLDSELLEDKIPDQFSQVKGFSRMMSEAKVFPGEG